MKWSLQIVSGSHRFRQSPETKEQDLRTAEPTEMFETRQQGALQGWKNAAASARLSILLVCLVLAPGNVLPADYNSYAIVKEDGSLRVRGRTIWLYGIHIPPTYESCLTFLRPVRCGPHAILVLELKIDPHFVHCREMSRNSDGSINAFCTVEGEDLSAYMLENGWAQALPGAPNEYFAKEKSAREKYLGIWRLLPGDMTREPSAD